MSEARLHIFDLDSTLIAGDSDQLWKHYAARHGLASPDAVARADHYLELYDRGELDDREFLAFQLEEFVGRTVEEVRAMTQAYFDEFLLPRVYPEAKELIDSLRSRGVPTAILTATNTALAAPCGAYFRVNDLLGTTLEVVNDRYTGGLAGEYVLGEGKIRVAAAYAARCGLTLAETAYYGDSINDGPILGAVGFPTAVNPSPALRELALRENWAIRDFRPPTSPQKN